MTPAPHIAEAVRREAARLGLPALFDVTANVLELYGGVLISAGVDGCGTFACRTRGVTSAAAEFCGRLTQGIAQRKT